VKKNYSFDFYNIRVTINSDSSRFASFIGKYLTAFEHFNQKIKTPIDGCLSSNVLFRNNIQIRDSLNWIMLGDSIFIYENELIYQNNYLKLWLQFGTNMSIRTVINVPPSKSIRSVLKTLKMRIDDRSAFHMYQKILRQAFHFPLFALLGGQGVFVGHGAALQWGNKAILLAGSRGVGKSTLSLALQLNENNLQFLSDNYVLVFKESLLPFPEPLRVCLKPWMKRFSQIMEPMFQIGERWYFVPTNVASRNLTNELFVFLLGRGNKLRIIPISAEEGLLGFMSSTFKLCGEFPHGSYVAFMPYLTGQVSALYAMPRLRVKRAYKLVLPKITSEQTANFVAKEVLRLCT